MLAPSLSVLITYPELPNLTSVWKAQFMPMPRKLARGPHLSQRVAVQPRAARALGMDRSCIENLFACTKDTTSHANCHSTSARFE